MPLSASQILELKIKMAHYRLSRECIDLVLMHYIFTGDRPDLIEMALESFGGTETYFHEPDKQMLEALKALNARDIGYVVYLPRKPGENVTKSSPEKAKEAMGLIKEMLKRGTPGRAISS